MTMTQACEDLVNLLLDIRVGMAETLARVADEIAARITCGGTIWIVGNGGSAAQASHLAAEFVGRMRRDRAPIAAVALGMDPSVTSCITNDWSGPVALPRQVDALVRQGDVLLAFSTSGKSANILNCLGPARKVGAYTVGFTGKAGMLAPCGALFAVPSTDTARIQEVHALLAHCLVEEIEARVWKPAAQEARRADPDHRLRP